MENNMIPLPEREYSAPIVRVLAAVPDSPVLSASTEQIDGFNKPEIPW